MDSRNLPQEVQPQDGREERQSGIDADPGMRRQVVCPSVIMMPQEGAEDARRLQKRQPGFGQDVSATPMVAAAITGARALGRRWRSSNLPPLAPRAAAAAAYSISLNTKI